MQDTKKVLWRGLELAGKMSHVLRRKIKVTRVSGSEILFEPPLTTEEIKKLRKKRLLDGVTILAG